MQQKGKDEYTIEFVHQQVKQMGWTTIVCKCDPENSAHLIVEELAKKGVHPTIPRETTKGSKGSLSHGEGSHTWTESQLRTLLIGLRKRYPGVVIYITDDIATWLIRHVGWLREKYKLGADGKSPHARLFGSE